MNPSRNAKKPQNMAYFTPMKRENNCRSDTRDKVHLGPDDDVVNVFLCESNEPVQFTGPVFSDDDLQLLRESLCFKE